MRLIWLAFISLLAAATAANGQLMAVQDVARLSTDGSYKLQGIGLVMGLPGTGDSGKELAMARPLAAVLERNGNPVPSLDELAKSRSVALVMVTCRIPTGGARVNDELPVTVSTLGSASSIDGGELFVAPLRGPTPGSPIFAMASGSIAVPDTDIPTVGNIEHGGQIIRELRMAMPEAAFELVLEPYYRGYGAATQIATAINDTYFNSPAAQGRQIARALDDRTIAVEVPVGERAQPAAFVADVMSTRITGALLKLPARVICNTRSGAISFTGDVRIGPVVLTMDGVSITTTAPPPVASPADPLVSQSRWVGISTDPSARGEATFQELKASLDKLNVPASDQIKLIQQLHKTGRLYAKLIVE